MSNVGMTTFVNVWCNRVSPNFSLTTLCRYLPSYFGPVRDLTKFAAGANGELLYNYKQNDVSRSYMTNNVRKTFTLGKILFPFLWFYSHPQLPSTSSRLIITNLGGRFLGSVEDRNH